MENKKELFQKYQEERTKDKTMFEVDRMAVLENFRKSVDFYNSFGLKNMNNEESIEK